jgi:hypothetical protein
MAFPFIVHENFESGTLGGFDSETDTGSLLDFPHYSVVATDPNSLMPYRGAYVLRNKLGDTNDHTLTEGSIDIADEGTAYFKWQMGLSKDFSFTADDTFNVFELQQAGGTVESSVGFRVTNSSQLIEIGVGDGTAPTSFVQWPAKGKWVTVELAAKISTTAAGTLTLYLDGAQVVALTGLTNAAAVGQGVLGSQLTLSTTLGAIYYDDFIMDDARIYPYRERFPHSYHALKSGHVFVGPGYIEGAALWEVATGDETLSLYDTDTANTNDANPVVELDSTAQTSVGGPLYFERGCYAVLGGTNPRGIVYMTRSNEKFGVKGPMFYSNWGLRYYGHNRTARPQNV